MFFLSLRFMWVRRGVRKNRGVLTVSPHLYFVMLHSFTRNYNDLSTDAGFQYEFYCDCCGNGFKSTFKESTTYNNRKRAEGIGRGASLLNNLFGGKLSGLSNAIEMIYRRLTR